MIFHKMLPMNPSEKKPLSRPLSFLSALLLAAALPFLGSCSKTKEPSGEGEFARLTNVGKNYYDKGEANKAREAFQQAVALNPSHPDAQLNLANAFLLASQSDKALQHAQEVLNLDRNSAAAHYVAGCAYLRLNQFEPALKSLQESQKIDDSVAAVYFQLGLAWQGLNQTEEAILEFQNAIDKEPEHPSAFYRLSQLLIRAGKKEEANQALERHREIQAKRSNAPSDAATYERSKHTLARLPFKLEQPEPNGVKVLFAEATATAFGTATNYHGPIGILDLKHDGHNSIFVVEGNDGFRLLENTNGTFTPRGEHLPGVPGAQYRKCLAAELHKDRFEDIVVLGENASHVFKFVTNAAITEVTRFAGLKDLKARDGVLVDLDFTGKLDLLTLPSDGQSARAYRNLGNFYFKDNTATSGLPATLSGALQMVVEDWNNDDLSDLFIVRSKEPPLLLIKERGGPLVPTNSPAAWPVATALATGDLNNDLRVDVVMAGSTKLECFFGGTAEQTSIPLGGFRVKALALVDYDNDGWLDICAVGEGVRVWRNLGRAGFRETTQQLGLDKFGRAQIHSLAAADFDQDGDTDLLLDVGTQGLQLWRNDGGNANHQLKVRLVGNRSNPSAIGLRLEVTSGGLRTSRTVQQLPVEIGVGRNTQVESVTVRGFDVLANYTDIKVQTNRVVYLDELSINVGSCPYLYAWDGKRFRFVTDLLGAAPLGLPISEQRYIDADPDEFVWLGNEAMLPPLLGHYVLQITEELREVLYLDEAKLFVVDHPPGTEVHTTGKLRSGPPFPPHEIVTLHQRRPLLQAMDHLDNDVTALLRENDSKLVSPANLRVPQLRGLAKPHNVTLDFGPLATDRPLVLALTGWLRFGGGTANVGASHDPELPFPFPQLEAEEAAGQWKPLDIVVGAPAGKTKTILVDLAGKLPLGSRRLRLSTAFEIHWDRIALFEKRDNSETHITSLAAARANLHWRGFSDFEDLPWNFPLTPDYGKARDTAHWRITPAGWCTRYGDVGELINQRDNALALLNGGDELTLSFAAGQVPGKPTGYERDFFLFSVGWDKDADVHCKLGSQVEPLPWHGMDHQLYGEQPRPAFANDGWMKKYNTRWVGPYTLSRSGQSASSRKAGGLPP